MCETAERKIICRQRSTRGARNRAARAWVRVRELILGDLVVAGVRHATHRDRAREPGRDLVRRGERAGLVRVLLAALEVAADGRVAVLAKQLRIEAERAVVT